MNKLPDNRSIASADRLAWVLDSSIPLPFGRSIGLDGVLGLLPGIGDAIGTALSGFIVFRAWRLGVGRAVLARMLGNIGLEMLVGTVPIVGDLFDFAFKANQRNVALLRENLTDATRSESRSRWVLALTGTALLLLGIAIVAAAIALALFFWQMLVGS